MRIKNNSGSSSSKLVDPNIMTALIKALNKALGLKDNVPHTDYVLGVWDYAHNRQETHTYGAFGSNDSNYVQPFWKMHEINCLLFESYRLFQSEDFENNPAQKTAPRDVANGVFFMNDKTICAVHFSQNEDVHKIIALLYVTYVIGIKYQLSKSDYKYSVEIYITQEVVRFKSDYTKNQLLKDIFKEFLEQIKDESPQN